MKNRYIVSLLLATCSLCSCGGNSSSNSGEVSRLTLSETNISLLTKETRLISVNEVKDQSLVTWTSSDEKIATVYNGYVTAVGDDGEAVITASYNNLTATCLVSVDNPSIKSRIEIDSEDVVISKGQEFTLTANVVCNNIVKVEESKHIEWKTTAPQYAQITSTNENTCVVYGRDVGVASVIAYTYDKGIYISKNISIEVKEDIDSDYLLITNGDYSFNGFTVTLPAVPYGNVKNTFTPKVLFNGKTDVSSEVVWSSDSPIITNNNGVLTANASGTARLVGTYTNGENTVQVNLEIKVYRPKFTPENAPVLDIEVMDLIDNHDSKIDLSYQLDQLGITDPVEEVKLFNQNVLVSYSNKIAKLDLTKLPKQGKQLGDTTIEISTKRATYSFSAYVLTKRIYTKEDIDLYFKPFINGNSSTANDGLFVVESDIDYNDGSVSRTSGYNPNESGFPWGGSSGFSGIIDGQGHSIKNFKTGLYGIFGKINAATIKNLNFSGVKYVAGRDFSILGNIAYGTTLENVNFEVVEAESHITKNEDCYGLIISNYTANVILKGVTIQTYCFSLCSLFGSGKNNSQTLQGSDTLVVKGTRPQRFCGLTMDLPSNSTFIPSSYSTDKSSYLVKNDSSLVSLNTGAFKGKTIEGIYNNETCSKKFVNSNGSRTTELANFLNRTTTITSTIKVNHSSGGEFTMFAKMSDGTGFYFTMTLFDKSLSSSNDFKEIYNSTKVDGVSGFSFGYYVLENDIDFANAECGETKDYSWITSGYAGTINGLGHKIKNIKTGNGGLLNAFRGTIENVTFDNVTLTDRVGACLIGQFIQADSCLIKNVNINIANSCANTKSSIFSSNYCVQASFENVQIHAEGLVLPNIFGSFGGIALSSSAFIKVSNMHIYCKSITAFGYSQASLEGSLVTDAISGVQIN